MYSTVLRGGLSISPGKHVQKILWSLDMSFWKHTDRQTDLQTCSSLYFAAMLGVKYWCIASSDYCRKSIQTDRYSFNGLFSRTTWVSLHQKSKTNLDFIETSITVFYRMWVYPMHQPKPEFETSLKSDFYFRFHSPLNIKSALLSFICIWDMVLICWKMWWPEPENCRNPNPHIPKIGKLLPVCLTMNRRWCDHIYELHAKFAENL